MQKIRVIEFIADSGLSGAPTTLVNFAKYADKENFSFLFVCPKGELYNTLSEIKGITVKSISIKSKWDISAILEFRKLVKKDSPQIVNCHGVRAGFIGRVACIGIKQSKVLYTEHLWTFQYRLRNPILHWLQILFLKILDRFTYRTIAVSKSVADFLVKSSITKKKKIAVLYSGIELPSQNLINQKESHDIKIIGFVGSLNQRKGVEYLLRAIPLLAESLPEKFRVIIVGDGDDKQRLLDLTKELSIKNYVKFVGSVNNVADYYQSFDVYVQPSLDEAFGMAALEAMSYGLPVVVSDVGGLPEVVNFNGSEPARGSFSDCAVGAMVLPRDYRGIAKALEKIIVDLSDSKKYFKNAIERANRFDASVTSRQREEFYRMIIR